MSDLTLHESLLALKHLVDSSQGANVAEIDQAISKVVEFSDPKSIVPLLSLLRDDALFDEGMFSLIHAAEAFDDEIYVEKMLEALPVLMAHSPQWASIAMARVLNSESTRASLVRKARSADSETKELLIQLLEKINSEDPVFVSKTLAVLLASKS